MKAQVPYQLSLSAAIAVVIMTFVAWINIALAEPSHVRVINHSDELLKDVQVCIAGSTCVSKKRIWPHEAWKVPFSKTVTGSVVITTSKAVATAKAGDDGLIFVAEKNGEIAASSNSNKPIY